MGNLAVMEESIIIMLRKIGYLDQQMADKYIKRLESGAMSEDDLIKLSNVIIGWVYACGEFSSDEAYCIEQVLRHARGDYDMPLSNDVKAQSQSS